MFDKSLLNFSYADVRKVMDRLYLPIEGEKESNEYKKTVNKMCNAVEDLMMLYMSSRAKGNPDKSLLVENSLIFHPIQQIRLIFNNVYFLLMEA